MLSLCLRVGKCIETETLNVILQAEFEVADASHDGTIEWHEFVAACDRCPTIASYFKSLERLSTNTQLRRQETTTLAVTTAVVAPSTQSTQQAVVDSKDEDCEADGGSESFGSSGDFGSVQQEEPAEVASAMAQAFDSAVVASNYEVDEALQRMDSAAALLS